LKVAIIPVLSQGVDAAENVQNMTKTNRSFIRWKSIVEAIAGLPNQYLACPRSEERDHPGAVTIR